MILLILKLLGVATLGFVSLYGLIACIADAIDWVGYLKFKQEKKKRALLEKDQGIEKNTRDLVEGLIRLAMLPDEKGDLRLEAMLNHWKRTMPEDEFKKRTAFLEDLLIDLESRFEVEALLDEPAYPQLKK